jgi:predicted negative regulator of RcsB-dependent stress response
MGDPILAESQSFSKALAQWHRDHDATAALAALEAHKRLFSGGQMQLEARLLRAEILLQQGREPEGLALLDSLQLPGLPRGRELQTVRGELRIKYGRCAEARRDLDYVLAKGTTDALARRAARAISLCP